LREKGVGGLWPPFCAKDADAKRRLRQRGCGVAAGSVCALTTRIRRRSCGCRPCRAPFYRHPTRWRIPCFGRPKLGKPTSVREKGYASSACV